MRVRRGNEDARGPSKRARKYEPPLERERAREPLRVVEPQHVMERDHGRNRRANGRERSRAVEHVEAEPSCAPWKLEREVTSSSFEAAQQPVGSTVAVPERHELDPFDALELGAQQLDVASRARGVELEPRELVADPQAVEAAGSAAHFGPRRRACRPSGGRSRRMDPAARVCPGTCFASRRRRTRGCARDQASNRAASEPRRAPPGSSRGRASHRSRTRTASPSSSQACRTSAPPSRPSS